MTDKEVEQIIRSNMNLQMNLASIRQDFEAKLQRTWVDLTDDDLEAEFGFIDELLRDCCYRTEAKLKEKNT